MPRDFYEMTIDFDKVHILVLLYSFIFVNKLKTFFIKKRNEIQSTTNTCFAMENDLNIIITTLYQLPLIRRRSYDTSIIV